MTRFLYLIGIKIWAVIPFQKQLFLFFKYLPHSLYKYSRDFWFVGRVKVPYLNTHFFLYSSKHDKGVRDIYIKGLSSSWDAGSIEIWGMLAEKATVVVDIGANIGLYAIAARAVNKKAIIYAFEPSYFALKSLNKNITINNFNIVVKHEALSNKNGKLTLYESETSSASSSFKPSLDLAEDSKTIKNEVNIQTFSDFFKQEKLSQLDLISIDVEMHEPEVLEGMEHLIELYQPDFIIEVLNNDIAKKIEPFFKNTNYLFYSINELNKKLTLQSNLMRNVSTDSDSYNFLICKKESAQYLKLQLN